MKIENVQPKQVIVILLLMALISVTFAELLVKLQLDNWPL